MYDSVTRATYAELFKTAEAALAPRLAPTIQALVAKHAASTYSGMKPEKAKRVAEKFDPKKDLTAPLKAPTKSELSR